MMVRTALNYGFILTTIIIIWMPGIDACAMQLEIDGDKISVDANHVPMQSLLKAVSGYGISIRMDLDINPLVTLTFRNRNLEDGLKAILRPHNHVFFWRASEDEASSSAASYRLDEIHIFRPGFKGRMVDLDAPEPPARDIPDAPAPALADTKVVILNNKVFVPVILGYRDREVEASLIFDTGAGTIVLHQNVAEELGVDDTQASSGRGVGGVRIETETAQLDYVRVGPHKKENLRADIIEYQGTADKHYNGLLGMNFIRGLKYTIDFNQQVIRWSP